MKKNLVFVISILFLCTSLVSASISINELDEIYNLGNNVDVTINLNPNSNSGWFRVDLICDGNNENLEKIIGESFAIGEEHKRSLTIPLDQVYIGNSSGICHLEAAIGTEKTTSGDFTISNMINSEINLDKESYNPADELTFTATSTKANGEILNGFLSVSGIISLEGSIVDGEITQILTVPDNIEAGKYLLNISIYDTHENGERRNKEERTLELTINQVMTSIEISVASLEIIPGENYETALELKDQTGNKMDGEIYVEVIPANGVKKNYTVSSGGNLNIATRTNDPSGNWIIIASANEIVEEKSFFVSTLQKVEFDFLENILIVKNIGNTIYDKNVEVLIGEETVVLPLNLDIGEEERYNLKAPNGEYNVIVASGETTTEQSLLLTGRAINVDNLRNLGAFNKYPLIWIFIILVLGSLATIVFFRFRKRTFKLKDRLKKESVALHDTDTEKEEKNTIDMSKKIIEGNAESSLVMKGEKSNAAIITVKIDNAENLSGEPKKEIVEILADAKEKKGMIEWKGDYVTIIFTPLVTKTFKNEILAVRAANNLQKKLENYNKKFKQKIRFSISVNSGEIINSLENKKLKYTSMGNTIILSKRIADSDSGKLLLSEKLRNKLSREVKAERVGEIGKNGIYEVKKLADQEANQEKLKELLKRMDRD